MYYHCIKSITLRIMENKFDAFHQPIKEQIKEYCLIEYLSIGKGYLEILAIRNNEIVSVGSLLYRCFRELSHYEGMEELLIELGQESQKFIESKRAKKPSLCFWKEELRVI